jgi:hypothetical protein
MIMENLKEFKELILRYESITLEEIQKISKIRWIAINGNNIAGNSLTGFGSKSTCTLCVAVNGYCDKCIYSSLTGNSFAGCTDDFTYSSIGNADTSEKLLNAFRKRAEYMRNLLIKNNIDFEKI